LQLLSSIPFSNSNFEKIDTGIRFSVILPNAKSFLFWQWVKSVDPSLTPVPEKSVNIDIIT